MEEIVDRDASEDEIVTEVALSAERKKEKKPGIIYLSSIPKGMNVMQVKEIFSQYGDIGRVFLQEDQKDKLKRHKKKMRAKIYTEGWVEFKSKRIAKKVARFLNNTQIGGKRKSKFYHQIWVIKYLPRFKWVHLSERLAYERAVHRHRMQAEIAQAKREANYFSLNVAKSENMKKKRKASEEKATDIGEGFQTHFYQRQTESDILENKRNEKKSSKLLSSAPVSEENERDEFLKTLFAK